MIFSLKTKVIGGRGCLEQLGETVEGFGVKKALLCTDAFLAGTPAASRIVEMLGRRGIRCPVYTRLQPEPIDVHCDEGAPFCAENGVELIVALGGGSVMDQSKAMAAIVTNGLPVRQLEDRPIPKRMLPLVCVPTTAGTGSEVTSFAVLTDRAKGVKYPLVDDALLPDEAILDPSLLAGVPPAVTADTGMDVLTHAAEAYVARGATPYTDALAEKAFTLAWQNLRPAWETAGESGAKGNMLLASNLAGIAFNAAGLGICHSLAHALGGRFHLPHGRLNALILPHVIHFNAADGTAAEKYGRLAKLCGLAANPRSLAAGLNRLRAQLKLPERLSACGVEGKELTAALDGLAEAAQADLCAPSNPRPAAAEDLKSLLRELA